MDFQSHFHCDRRDEKMGNPRGRTLPRGFRDEGEKMGIGKDQRVMSALALAASVQRPRHLAVKAATCSGQRPM